MNAAELIRQAAEKKASDIHLVCGEPPIFRIAGKLVRQNQFDRLERRQAEQLAVELAADKLNELRDVGEVDTSATIAGVRVRINLFRQQNGTSSAIRLLADHIPDLSSLGLPPKVDELCELRQGFILVTGETGSGKSTTLAAIIDRINHTRAEHVLTLEDPIEYQYTADQCLFNQREIGRDTTNFAAALRAALREDPDIILVGELRDRETIETALTAAETGHLVLATLHTGSAADTIDRIVDVFPEERQQQIRMQLSMTLRAVLSQQLLPDKLKGGRVCACELMVVNAAIRNLIREGKTPQINNAIATASADGCMTMDAALLRLLKNGRITEQEALEAAHDAAALQKHIHTGI
jgi:twitching motility protein PilT